MNLEAKLSKREAEVAEILAFTMDRSAAADKLCISEGTLSAHSYRIYEKLQINTKAELVIWWFMKKLGVRKEQIPYFKLVPVLILCFGILSEKEMICRRRLRVDRMARVEIKITA
ncbi:helix-turn-helix domain-containing protein [Elizabethkingia anophelis]|uniref:Bacterial regulatory proteins, luxR family n=1 Tax=Elizabethkingia anophelis TaxID=1117645 RepID=A0A7Z7LVY4_9FLAO|nr:helix-turn-helix transcriptional regulator [Elizabethkingia anophelis]EJC8061968.1 helix-turn-helix transcriptional regulator [Elizabethkingia anophelis]MCL1640060.1 helix-turn-helix transcriptional regulator [Elizabethkingia anophelis]MCT4035619.1 helix-turn-helix transcriptional regulator [Elizabethkingia anophelis]MDV3551079.1 LuxR family transcriptional regulator [Elizabethkingia anophelis]MDV3570093.1 LuxR family transcriptional regulator [Elizabethkingia anophelis]